MHEFVKYVIGSLITACAFSGCWFVYVAVGSWLYDRKHGKRH